MREIKFRNWEPMFGMHDPWDLKEKTVFNSERNISGSKTLEVEWMPGTIFMQSTGLKDRNGKEIFEGDLLMFFDKIIAEVVFESFDGWCYKWIDPTYIRVRQHNPEPFFRNIMLWEVAGNIYENPELLKIV